MKSTIDPEVKKIINETIDKAVKKATQAIMEANEQAEEHQRNYFKDTEKLLYSLPALKLKVEQDEEDMQNGHVIQKRKSADVVRFGGGSKYDNSEDEYLESRRGSMERTKREIQRIEKALDVVKEDAYYDIIELKYFDNHTIEYIAEHFDKDETTIRRNKNRLINKLKLILFGADAL
ncbi:hypothetical protein A7W90_16150 [Clostridium sp. Bc-iso-3]|nr:hypothetical protein A7W90_16150 [Clostridium sp. Bc-iso-3]